MRSEAYFDKPKNFIHVPRLSPRSPPLPRRNSFQFLRSVRLCVGVAGDARRIGLGLCAVGLALHGERDWLFDRRDSHAVADSACGQPATIRWPRVRRFLPAPWHGMPVEARAMRLLAVLLKHHDATVHRRPFRYFNFSGNVVADACMMA